MKLTTIPVLFLVKPVGSTDMATLACESPHAQPLSDPDPSLQDGVRDGLSGLNIRESGGMPLMLAVSPDNGFSYLNDDFSFEV